jgi:DNA-binding transcriptional LysR family regulator
MDTFKIKAILGVVKYKNMSRAAEELSYTPSAISHIISDFEEELGVTLFDRNSRGVELTESARKLLPEFEAMIECERGIYAVANRLAGKEKAEIRIATYSSLSRNFLPNIIKGFRKKYPDINISVNVSDHISELLMEDKADVIFGAVSTFGDNDWFEITEDEFLVVSPPGTFRNRDQITREELYLLPQIFTDDEPLRDYFDVDKFSDILYFRSDDDLSVINMVKNGMGVTVLPSLVLKEICDGVQTVRLLPPLKRKLGVAFKKKRKTLHLKLFLEYVKETSK